MLSRIDELDRLRDRIADLEDMLGMTECIPIRHALGLTNLEAKLLGLLYRRQFWSSDCLCRALFGDRDGEQLTEVRVFVSKLRTKMRPHNISIKNHWGDGYSIDSENRERVKLLMNASTAPAGSRHPEEEERL
jgi:DNA-binding response OmpR family regulator